MVLETFKTKATVTHLLRGFPIVCLLSVRVNDTYSQN